MSEYVLEVLDGELKGRVVSLTSERFTIGRRPNNDLTLKDEKASSNHAEIVREGDAWVLRDLDSRNGTFLDGRKVSELGLSPGDVFKIGLTGMCFRRASDAAVAVTEGADPEGLSVHRIDQARLQRVKGGGSMLGMVVALIVVAGAGGWVWFQYGGDRSAGARRGQVTRAVIPGNLLSAEASGLDDDAAWELGAGGTGFAVGGPAHSGSNALTATHESESPPFALARLKEPLRVLGDDVLDLSAQVQCDGGASVALRVVFSSSREDEPLTLVASTSTTSATSWERLAGSLVVPAGLDRARVEVVALLPSADSAARVDEVALVRNGSNKGGALSAKNGVRLLISGASAAIVRTQDVLLQAVRPLPEAGSALAAFHAAARATLAEAAGTLTGAVDEDRFALTVAGVDAFALEFASSEGLLVRAGNDQPFSAAATDFAGDAVEILLGGGNTRVMLALPAAAPVTAHDAAGGFHLHFGSAGEIGVVVGFEEERREARERVRSARTEAQAGRYAEALVPLQEAITRFPHDDAVLAEAQQLRAEILDGLSSKLDKLAQDLDTAKFFNARSGLVRVLSDLDELERAYGAPNLGRPELVERVRVEASSIVANLDAQQIAQRASGLHNLAEAMQQSGQTELAAVIDGYLKQHERKQ